MRTTSPIAAKVVCFESSGKHTLVTPPQTITRNPLDGSLWRLVTTLPFEKKKATFVVTIELSLKKDPSLGKL
jgi:hypothetical protein